MPGGDTSNGQSGAVAPPSSTFHQITPPKYLDLKHSGGIAENWKLWKEKYNNYFVISRLDRETPEFQLAMFKHTIGDDALKVIKTFNYAEGETRVNRDLYASGFSWETANRKPQNVT